ncbi:hypothetical protein KIN20_019652 [Parelaphostrongylus tenuis]|uniref:Uncharacterized protein n=1 Tax=Parelaphostrongylus tenuis TaxID=148309 RepID=A0AAD5QSK8_PARTN|nr:hypothetical protein KIN20_019652 [Parelaphostrongylus tenuis]
MADSRKTTASILKSLSPASSEPHASQVPLLIVGTGNVLTVKQRETTVFTYSPSHSSRWRTAVNQIMHLTITIFVTRFYKPVKYKLHCVNNRKDCHLKEKKLPINVSRRIGQTIKNVKRRKVYDDKAFEPIMHGIDVVLDFFRSHVLSRVIS